MWKDKRVTTNQISNHNCKINYKKFFNFIFTITIMTKKLIFFYDILVLVPIHIKNRFYERLNVCKNFTLCNWVIYKFLIILQEYNIHIYVYAIYTYIHIHFLFIEFCSSFTCVFIYSSYIRVSQNPITAVSIYLILQRELHLKTFLSEDLVDWSMG